MRASNIIIISLAAIFGVLSIFAGRAWLTRQADARARQLEAAAQKAPVSMNKIVVAGEPLRFGTKLHAGQLREIDWPAGELPSGAFKSISEVFAKSGERTVLSAMDPNEPLLNTKISGPGERVTLSRMLREGMKAVTIQANAVAGVGGFVNPGDHVDVILTRNAGETGTPASADVLIQNVRVIGVDQSADDRKFKAAVAQTVTLEVPIRQAQRILLGASIGTLSLVLRSAGDLTNSDSDRVSLVDLGFGGPDQPPAQPTAMAAAAAATRSLAPAVAPSSPAPSAPGWSLTSLLGGGQSGNPSAAQPKPEPKTVTIGVSRGLDRKEYRVPAQDQTVPGSRLAATN